MVCHFSFLYARHFGALDGTKYWLQLTPCINMAWGNGIHGAGYCFHIDRDNFLYQNCLWLVFFLIMFVLCWVQGNIIFYFMLIGIIFLLENIQLSWMVFCGLVLINQACQAFLWNGVVFVDGSSCVGIYSQFNSNHQNLLTPQLPEVMPLIYMTSKSFEDFILPCKGC